LADYIQTPKEKLGENYRVTHYNDPVPRLPPAMMGYAHYTPEIYISTKNQKTVALSDILTLNGSAISKGNDQFRVLDVEAHRWYFNAVSACYMANTPSSGTATSSDLATNWAGTIIGLMGNNSGIVLVGGKAANTAATISAVAGLLASMSTNAANTLLGMIPGGFLVQPFLPSAATAGALTAVGTSGLLSSLELLFGSGTTKSGSKFIIDS
jgi:ethanolamine utilization microcompartment shell protein EutS